MATPKNRRPTNDTPEDRYRIFLHLKAAFGLIKRSMENEFFMPAYVTAFSIIEDRIFAMYVVAKRVANEPAEERNFRISILDYAKTLKAYGYIDAQTYTKLQDECKHRNKRVHGAMWRLVRIPEIVNADSGRS
jgi:hypothetical protein